MTLDELYDDLGDYTTQLEDADSDEAITLNNLINTTLSNIAELEADG